MNKLTDKEILDKVAARFGAHIDDYPYSVQDLAANLIKLTRQNVKKEIRDELNNKRFEGKGRFHVVLWKDVVKSTRTMRIEYNCLKVK